MDYLEQAMIKRPKIQLSTSEPVPFNRSMQNEREQANQDTPTTGDTNFLLLENKLT